MDLKEVGVSMRNWIDSAKDRDYLKAPMNSTQFPNAIHHEIN